VFLFKSKKKKETSALLKQANYNARHSFSSVIEIIWKQNRFPNVILKEHIEFENCVPQQNSYHLVFLLVIYNRKH